MRLILIAACAAAWMVGCGKEPSPSKTTRAAEASGTEAESAKPRAVGERNATLTIFAAASTSDVLTALAKRFEQERGVKVQCSFAASSALAKQIENGAQADVFISADEKWMNYLQERRLIDAATRRDLLGNALVLIATKGRSFEVQMEPGFDLIAALKAGAGDGGFAGLALADPDHVPAGRYAKAALQHFGWWDAIASEVVPAEDVRRALAYVEMGELPVGIVYATDADASSKVEVIARFPEESHDPIRYPIAIISGANPKATEFVAFLRSDDAATEFKRHGFIVLSE
jgi:molybdate transport system substrate-binding protein